MTILPRAGVVCAPNPSAAGKAGSPQDDPELIIHHKTLRRKSSDIILYIQNIHPNILASQGEVIA
jgi:hypothetical protein